MSDSTAWSMDRLAAQNLLARLNVETTAGNLELAAEHFARHRDDAIGWAAERAHARMVKALEAAGPMHFSNRSEDWAEGFRFAEHQVATILPEELLDLGPARIRSKGQVLRALVRQARSR